MAVGDDAVVLCADDFGLTEGISRGILDLAARGRLSATSAMTNHGGWRRFGAGLRELPGPFGVGLHLTLTDGAPLGAMPRLAPTGRFPDLGTLMRASFSGRLDWAEIRGEIARQLDAFEAVLGRAPDFVDGHQHAHVLPGVRGPLLAELAARGHAGNFWIRDPSDTPSRILRRPAALKASVVAALATGFRGAAARVGIATNDGFSGFSAFDPNHPFAAEASGFFSALGSHPVVMCHPGRAEGAPSGSDAIAATRPLEYAYLASDAFASLLRERRLVLRPAPR